MRCCKLPKKWFVPEISFFTRVQHPKDWSIKAGLCNLVTNHAFAVQMNHMLHFAVLSEAGHEVCISNQKHFFAFNDFPYFTSGDNTLSYKLVIVCTRSLKLHWAFEMPQWLTANGFSQQDNTVFQWLNKCTPMFALTYQKCSMKLLKALILTCTKMIDTLCQITEKRLPRSCMEHYFTDIMKCVRIFFVVLMGSLVTESQVRYVMHIW